MQEDNERRILAALYRAPDDEKSLRELERETKLSVMTVSKAVVALEAKRIVHVQSRPHAKLVRANTEHPDYRWRKRLANLEELYASGLIDAMQETMIPKAIILFGSFGNGSDTSRSDIDLCIIEPTDIRHEWKDFEKKLGKPINVVFLEKDAEPARAFVESLANGIILEGFLNPWRWTKNSREN